MFLMLQSIGIALGIVQATAPIAGASIAAGIAAEIVKSCEEVSQQKSRAKLLGEKSLQLANALQDESHGIEGTALQGRIDETVDVLTKTLTCTQRWRNRNVLTRWLRRADMERDIDRCHANLDTAITALQPSRNQVDAHRVLEEVRVEGHHHHAENRELLLRVLESQVEMQKILKLHQAGQPIAIELMGTGQKFLKEMREEFQPPASTSTSRGSKPPAATQQYLKMQKGLAMLQRVTGILPPEKVLDGEVRRLDDLAIAGGSSSDIWRALWLEEQPVALKGMRNVRIDDTGAQNRFVREIEVWSKLSNKHILPFYGIVTDLGAHIHIVSPWLDNGDVLEYIRRYPDTDKMRLIRGAAEGLKYLHSENVIHGNIKCTNILVSDSGDACISDFGMAKVIEDVTKTPASTTLARAGGTRWLAPEVVEGAPPSKESDTYSFGMAILEMLTEKYPFPEYKTDAAVIRALMKNAMPKRPVEPNGQSWITDSLWALIQRCWSRDSSSRPAMQEVVDELERM